MVHTMGLWGSQRTQVGDRSCPVGPRQATVLAGMSPQVSRAEELEWRMENLEHEETGLYLRPVDDLILPLRITLAQIFLQKLNGTLAIVAS